MAATSSVAPSAVIDDSAALAPDVFVGPGVVIETGVVVGSGSRLLAGTVLRSGTTVGRGCVIGPYAVLGGEPMDSRFRGEPSSVEIGDDVSVREFATLHRATGEGAVTRVGARTLVMSYVHVSHNSQIGTDCVLTSAAQLGGHSTIGDHAVVGASSVMHQFCRVGRYAMFGAASAANQDVLPFAMARGNPAKHYRLNRVGLQRAGIVGERYSQLEGAVRLLRRRDLSALAELAAGNEDVAYLLEFIHSSRRGVARFVGGGR